MTLAAIDFQLLANAGFPPVTFKPGETIFAEGDKGDNMYVIRSGEVEVERGGKIVETLSAGGIFVATHMLKPVGSQIEVTIHLPDAPAPIQGTGDVRWIREYNERSDVPPGMGIRFTELDGSAKSAIEANPPMVSGTLRAERHRRSAGT